MEILLISFETIWRGEESYALAYVEEYNQTLQNAIDSWAYNEFIDCGHDYSDFRYDSEEEWKNDLDFQYEDYYTVSIREINEEEAKEYEDFPIIYDERK